MKKNATNLSEKRQRLVRLNLPQSTLSRLASTPSLTVYASDVVRWLDGIAGASSEKLDRLDWWLDAVEGMLMGAHRLVDLSDSDAVFDAVTKHQRSPRDILEFSVRDGATRYSD